MLAGAKCVSVRRLDDFTHLCQTLERRSSKGQTDPVSPISYFLLVHFFAVHYVLTSNQSLPSHAEQILTSFLEGRSVHRATGLFVQLREHSTRHFLIHTCVHSVSVEVCDLGLFHSIFCPDRSPRSAHPPLISACPSSYYSSCSLNHTPLHSLLLL